MSGIRLSTGRPASVRAHVHLSTDEWKITSDVRVEDVSTAPKVLDRILPGRLGSFVYPDDAVFSLRNARRTSLADLDATLCAERSIRRRSERMNHISVAKEDAPLEEEASEDEEEGDEEIEEDEAQDRCDVEEGAPWDDDDDADSDQIGSGGAAKKGGWRC